TRNGIAAHYDYAPFGAVTRAISASAITDNTFTTDNPFRFSSEHHDDTLGLVYYNYRHYNPNDGRWASRDSVEDLLLEYSFVKNYPFRYDVLGLVLGSPLSPINSIIFTPNVSQPPSIKETFCELLLKWFEKWFAQNENLEWTKELLPCPKELKCIAGKYDSPDPAIWKFSNADQDFHPGGVYELRMAVSSGAGNQCIYDECGKIVTSIPTAGTADTFSPSEWESPSNWDNVVNHFINDVIPYKCAEKLDLCYPNYEPSFVERYYMRRPIIIDNER
ncbi:MAG: hypothetical protein IKW38_03240, partial [Kiritimatiellae bacterium]|nr:hypothetical protein [Kiritimatiellia bacterium]